MVGQKSKRCLFAGIFHEASDSASQIAAVSKFLCILVMKHHEKFGLGGKLNADAQIG
jgi:hypothetical protein